MFKKYKKLKKIIIFDNSNDEKLKKKINLIYPKIKFILSKKIQAMEKQIIK